MDNNEKQTFRKAHMLNLRGKDYLPVAARVVVCRDEHPDWTIKTSYEMIELEHEKPVLHMRAMIFDGNRLLSTAFKRVRNDGSGPAAQFPAETAETGAIGRALALCGYGTLSGDLDEHDQLSDAPVSKTEWKLKK